MFVFFDQTILYHKERHMWAVKSQSWLHQTAWEILEFYFLIWQILIDGFAVRDVPGLMT